MIFKDREIEKLKDALKRATWKSDKLMHHISKLKKNKDIPLNKMDVPEAEELIAYEWFKKDKIGILESIVNYKGVLP